MSGSQKADTDSADLPTWEELRQLEEMLSTPIDFDRLVADGVLRKKGAWWKILDVSRLPQHVRCKIRAAQTGGLVQFYKPARKRKGATAPPAKSPAKAGKS